MRSTDKKSIIVKPDSSISEIYKILKLNIGLLSGEKERRVILVTSTMQHEGKTTTLVNLAYAHARAGQRVLTIDCNLRSPCLHDIFNVDNNYGIRQCMNHEMDAIEMIQPTPNPNLSVITAGQASGTKSDLLALPRMMEIIDRLKETFDIILIDSAHAYDLSDPYYLAPYCDGIILVIKAGRTKRAAVQKTAAKLADTGVGFIGTVLNEMKDFRDQPVPR